ncbi:MAG TPA: hypothetical protein VMQ44_03955 [Candidatus Saccharimonadales bacterium]|nr:hypothetical protein [Candidatus Saccharimonadales bacterium]
MRYYHLIVTWSSDLILLAATIVVLHGVSFTLRQSGFWVIAALAWWVWYRSGNIQNWRPSVIKDYLRKAKDYGL